MDPIKFQYQEKVRFISGSNKGNLGTVENEENWGSVFLVETNGQKGWYAKEDLEKA